MGISRLAVHPSASSASASSSSSSSASASSSPEPSPSVPKRKREDDTGSNDEDSSDESDAAADANAVVLSHAERRRQKKAEKQKGDTSKKQKLSDGTSLLTSSSVPSKRQNSVWVGNMSFKTTNEALNKFFDGCGEITRIHMPTKVSATPGMKGENRGFAYVDFGSAEAKIAAIARSEQPLLGRRLLIKDGDDFVGRPAIPGGDAAVGDAPASSKTHSKTAQKILRAQKQPPAPTLFLGNLGFETTEQSIRELLEAHRVQKKPKDTAVEGEVKKEKDVWIRKVRMGTFEDSGLCKGFAFVDFTTTDHATTALINPRNHHLNGRNLVVEYASADAVRRGAPKEQREPGSSAAPKRREAKSRGPRAERLERNRMKAESQVKEGPVVPAEQPGPSKPPREERQPHGPGDSGGSGMKAKGPRSRPKPGAALALAKRESAAIVTSTGKKIVF